MAFYPYLYHFFLFKLFKAYSNLTIKKAKKFIGTLQPISSVNAWRDISEVLFVTDLISKTVFITICGWAHSLFLLRLICRNWKNSIIK